MFGVSCPMPFRQRRSGHVMMVSYGRGGVLRDKEVCMHEDYNLSRERLLRMSLSTGEEVSFSPTKLGYGQSTEIVATSEQDIGPFYPLSKPHDLDEDLTTVKGRAGKARGQILHLSGRVLDLNGKPVPNAQVEIWQANTFGRYAHPGDSNPAPLDPNFEGHGVSITNDEGTYSFKTVKPVAYPAAEGLMRAPHIHFLVTAGPNRFITQMYFPGEPLNENDPLLGGAENKESLIPKVTPAPKDAESGALVATWDIVLSRTGE
jgi:protocatechuate 3,4-dioxygenase, beta subunit